MNPSNLRSIDLNLLTVFDAIHQTRNLSRAAEKINMSQPAISHALGRLRHMLDDPLFVRAAGGMQPTPRAQALASPIRDVLNTVAGMLSPQSGFDYAGVERKFKLTVGDYGACILLPSLCRRMETMARGVTLVLSDTYGDKAEEEMRLGSLDLLLSFYPVADPAFQTQPVIKDTISIVARKNHPHLREEMSLKQLCDLRHVVVTWPRGKGIRPGEQVLFDSGLRRTEFVEVQSAMQAPAILTATDAIATVPTRLGRHWAERYDLHLWSPAILKDVAITTYIAWHRSQDDDPGHTWFRNTVIEMCGGL